LIVASGAANPDSVNPCALITVAEAQSALGTPVSAGAFLDDGIFRHCTFTATTDTGSGKPWVTVWHNGNELQIQISSHDDAGKARAKTEELKVAGIAITRF
jgi:hypothetical protein